MIRTAAPSDARSIAEVQTRSWEVYRGILADEVIDGQTVEARLGYWTKALEFDPPYATWVCELEGRVIGFAHVGPNRDTDVDPEKVGELWGMYLDPPVFGRGFGRELMGAVDRHFADAGFQGATLWVLDGNERARRFYERAGWHADGATKTERSRSGHPLHEVRYRLDLADPPSRRHPHRL